MGDRAAAPRPELDELVAELRRPFTAAAVKWKIQTNPKDASKSALCVAFIDARLVTERLNAVVGPDWDDEYQPCVHDPSGHPKGVLCKLTVRGHTRTDVGYAAQSMDTDMGLKGLYSDAFKRAAVKFGIGVSIYALPQQWVKAADLDSWQSQGKPRWGLSRKAEQQLRARYEQWLSERGVELFGQPLDHGDVDESQGDVDTHAPAPVESGPTYGLPANEDELERVYRAMKWLGADPPTVLSQLEDSFGYVPGAVVRGIGLAAKSAREQQEKEAAGGDDDTSTGSDDG